MKWLPILALTLAACAPSVDAVAQAELAGLPQISFGGGSGFSGGNQTTLYSNDQALVVTWAPGGEDRRETLTQLAPGTFERTQAIALEGIADLTPFAGEVCLDYGTDSIRVLDAGGDVLAEAAAPCPHGPLLELQGALARSLSAP